MSVMALATPRSVRGKTTHTTKTRRQSDDMHPSQTLVIKPHNTEMKFASETVFTLPSAASGQVSSMQSSHHPVVFTWPIDGAHLLVACGSCMYVVRLLPSCSEAFVPSRLPVAVVSGCVPDYYNVPSFREEGKKSLHTSNKRMEERRKMVRKSSAPFPSSSSLGFSTEPIMNVSDYVNNNNNINGTAGRNISFGTQAIKCVSSSPKHRVHSFLLADAITHSIWAVEVLIETLKVRVVCPSQYWCREDNDDDSSDYSAGTALKHQCPECIQKPKALLGGVEGFVDGPFHVARFASPSALCWRIDESNNDNGDGTPQCSVLFVNDSRNHAIRYVNFRSKLVRTVIGLDGVPGYRDGCFRAARLQEAAALTWCSSGLLFLDNPNGAIRLITGLKKKTRQVNTDIHDDYNNDDKYDENFPMRSEGMKSPSTVRVWTVAGGLHADTRLYVDDKEPYKASLGTTTAMTLMPDGSGILFAETNHHHHHHHALRLVSSHGVETFFFGGLFDFTYSSASPGSSSSSGGLMNCSHITVCRLTTSDASSRYAFLVSSGVQGKVSLLLSCGEMETIKEEGRKGREFNFSTITSLLPVQCTEVKNGVLRMYTCNDGKTSSLLLFPKTIARNTLSCGRKQHDLVRNGPHQKNDSAMMICRRKNKASSSFSMHKNLLPRVYFSTTRTQAPSKSGPFDDAISKLFEVYLYYTSQSSAPSTMMKTFPLEKLDCNHEWGLLNTSYSLSLLGFWRFIIHSEYFGISPSPPCTMMAAHCVSRNNQNIVDGGFSVLQDWRCIVELLHSWSVWQHGYHVYSIMGFGFFCRAILFMYAWKQHKRRCTREDNNNEEETNNSIHYLMTMRPIDELSEDEVIEAYNDAVQQVKKANINLRWAMESVGNVKDEKNEKMEREEENKGDEFLAADDVLCILRRNEKSLQHLFQAYSQRVTMHKSSSGNSTVNNEEGQIVRQLRALFLSADAGEHMYTDYSFYAMTYGMFHRLFHALDVFPKLISESLLRRSFVDALVTPLFHNLRRESFAAATDHEKAKDGHSHHDHQQSFLSVTLGMPRDVEKKYANSGKVVLFVPFVEAFTRVALTAFSLCSEHDSLMYPTAALKVEALMRWVNQTVECRHARERGGVQQSTLLSSNFIAFDVPAAMVERKH